MLQRGVSADIRHNIAQFCQGKVERRPRKIILAHR
jgi:hypothetical protein